MPKTRALDARVRRATNVTLPVELVAQAKALQVNVSQACENGLSRSVSEALRARWLSENKEAIEAYNERIERDGPILNRYRRF
jgi:Post-segregation antitoxin (ccd killing mechanism protein) encoded by the F plasmid